jgi:hypothetical protein
VIKKALGISGIYSDPSIWRSKVAKGKDMAQIDLLLDRRDNSINICEMKFYAEKYMIDKKYAAELHRKRSIFKQETNTNKHLFQTLITAHGIHGNEHSIGLVDQQLTLEDLFMQ